MTRHICINAPEGYIVYAPLAHTCVNPRSRSPLMLGLDFGAPFVGFGPRRASHCLPTYSASHPASMLLSRLLIATPYNDSIMVRTPAPRDHPPAFVRYRLPRAPETWTPFTRGCMTSEPHSTRSERLLGAFSKFSWCSGLGGRTVWRVMMAHLECRSLSRSVRG